MLKDNPAQQEVYKLLSTVISEALSVKGETLNVKYDNEYDN
jgi:hypothetical protein